MWSQAGPSGDFNGCWHVIGDDPNPHIQFGSFLKLLGLQAPATLSRELKRFFLPSESFLMIRGNRAKLGNFSYLVISSFAFAKLRVVTAPQGLEMQKKRLWGNFSYKSDRRPKSFLKRSGWQINHNIKKPWRFDFSPALSWVFVWHWLNVRLHQLTDHQQPVHIWWAH